MACFCELPREKLTLLNQSFYEIGLQLNLLKKEILSNPITGKFLLSPYTKSQEEIELLDRTWERICNSFCQKNNVPGFGKRVLMCTNGGIVFLNVQTYNPRIPKLSLSYTIVQTIIQSNFIYTELSDKPVNLLNIDKPPYPFNPEQTDISNVVLKSTSQSKSTNILLCGSTTPPPTDPNNTTPTRPKAIFFEDVSNHASRKEIAMVLTSRLKKPYGYSSRFSETNFNINYYVATNIVGNDGYEIVIRLSYF